MSEEDLAFETLRSALDALALELDLELVEKCYAIQKSHQFSSDRSVSLTLMDRLIDGFVDKLMAEGSEGAAV